MPSARQLALAAARRTGVEPQLRAVRAALRPESTKRNERDDENLRLLLAATLRPDSDCIDVGANQGFTLELMRRYAPRGRHVAFEPLPDLAAALRGRFPDVEVREAALSDRAGTREFTVVPDDPAYSGFRRPGFEGAVTTQVAIERLDDVLPEDFVPALLKVDVEGAEQQVLEGAIATITRHQPLVVLEHGDSAALYGTTAADIHDLLCARAGLSLFDMDGVGPLGRDEFGRVAAPAGNRWNFFARSLTRSP